MPMPDFNPNNTSAPKINTTARMSKDALPDMLANHAPRALNHDEGDRTDPDDVSLAAPVAPLVETVGVVLPTVLVEPGAPLPLAAMVGRFNTEGFAAT